MVYSAGQMSFLFAKETVSYGTPVAPSKDIGLVKTGYEPTATGNYSEGMYLGDIEMGSLVPTHYEFSGSVEFDVQHFRFLEYVLGGTVSHDNSDTPDIKHTFTGANTIPSMTVDASLDATSDAVFRYPGTAIKSCTLNFNNDAPLSCSLDLVSKTVDTSDTSATAAVVDDLPVFTPAMTSISCGTTLTLVKDLTLTIENNVAESKYLSSTLRQHAVPTHRKFGLTFSMDFTDMTEYERFLGSTSPQTTVPPFTTVINTTNGVAAASGLRQLYMTINNCKYTEVTPKQPSDGVAALDVTVVGRNLGTTYSYDDIVSGSW